MSKPKHRRCQVCDRVTSRYSRTQNAGAFVVKIWVRDQLNGEVTRDNGRVVLCKVCAE
jgi:hypothetical protein